MKPRTPRPHSTRSSWDQGLSSKKLERLAEKFGTPFYLYSVEALRARCSALKSAFPRAQVRYAMKANSCPALLKVVHAAGLGVDTVSPWEVRLAREVGFKKREVLYSGNNPSTEELRALDRAGVVINIDALSALVRLADVSRTRRVSLRINPDVGDGHHKHVITAGPESKFGLDPEELPEARKIAARHGLKIVGLHQHIGSGLFDLDVYSRSLEPLASLVDGFPHLSFVDVGGGFGVPYKPEDQPVDLEAWGRFLTRWHERIEKLLKRPIDLLIEPGRYVMAEAGVLVCRVTTIKRTRDRTFVGVDSGMHHLVRPALYGSYHPVRVVPARTGTPERCFVVGPICESGDVLAEERMMVAPKEGDLLVVGCAGAYGYSMASQYNLRPRPAEVALESGRAHLVRARETYRDVVRRRDVGRV